MNDTINLDLSPLDTVILMNEVEELIEKFESTSNLRPLTAYEDIQHRSLEKIINQVNIQAHKIDLDKVRDEITVKADIYNLEQRTDPTKNN
jgi:hypothetical protein